MAAKKLSFEEAVARLDEIVKRPHLKALQGVVG